MERGQVYILTDENQILEPCFKMDVYKNHLEAMNEFSKKYKLNYNFNKDDYQMAPCLIAENGHLLIKTVENSGFMIIYIPRTVTDRQNELFHSLLPNFSNYSYIAGFKLDDDDTFSEVEGLNRIVREIDRRNILNESGENKNVGKKI